MLSIPARRQAVVGWILEGVLLVASTFLLAKKLDYQQRRLKRQKEMKKKRHPLLGIVLRRQSFRNFDDVMGAGIR